MMEIINAINSLELWEALLFGFTVGISIKIIHWHGQSQKLR